MNNRELRRFVIDLIICFVISVVVTLPLWWV